MTAGTLAPGTMAPGTLTGISLGPGDPGLITVRGLELLRQADRIYHAGSRSADRRVSHALGILRHYGLEEGRLRAVHLPMSDDRSLAEATYREAFAAIAADCAAGLRVAFAAEGDVSFFSTFTRLASLAAEAALPVAVVAGVPAFLLGAALQGRPLASGRERVAILPRLSDAGELVRCLEQFEVVVLMKIRGIAAAVADLAGQHGWSVLLCENLGTPEQFVSARPSDLRTRTLPYLSLVIVRAGLS
jgi:precorrin-2/cobalt-factor-2 C20-methyltransferase